MTKQHYIIAHTAYTLPDIFRRDAFDNIHQLGLSDLPTNLNIYLHCNGKVGNCLMCNTCAVIILHIFFLHRYTYTFINGYILKYTFSF